MEILHFSWYHLLTNISFYLIGYLDTLMLASVDKNGVASVPVYLVSVFIASLMHIPFRAMANAVIPVLNKTYYDNDREKLQDIYKRSGINILIVSIAMALIIGLNLGNAVAILPPGYGGVVPLVMIMMLGKLADLVTGLNNEVISLSKLYKFSFRISIILLTLVVGFNLILIPKYGAYGAAWGVTISMIIFNVAKTIFLQKKMSLHPFSKQSLQVLGAGIVTAVAVYFIPAMANWMVDTLIRTAIIIVIYFLILIRFHLSKDLDEYFSGTLERLRSFRKKQ